MSRHTWTLAASELTNAEDARVRMALRYDCPVSLRGRCWRVRIAVADDGSEAFRLEGLPPTFCYSAPIGRRAATAAEQRAG